MEKQQSADTKIELNVLSCFFKQKNRVEAFILDNLREDDFSSLDRKLIFNAYSEGFKNAKTFHFDVVLDTVQKIGLNGFPIKNIRETLSKIVDLSQEKYPIKEYVGILL